MEGRVHFQDQDHHACMNCPVVGHPLLRSLIPAISLTCCGLFAPTPRLPVPWSLSTSCCPAGTRLRTAQPERQRAEHWSEPIPLSVAAEGPWCCGHSVLLPSAPGGCITSPWVLTRFHVLPSGLPAARGTAKTGGSDLFTSLSALLPSTPGHCSEGTSLPCPVLKGLSLHQTPPQPCPQRTLSLACGRRAPLLHSASCPPGRALDVGASGWAGGWLAERGAVASGPRDAPLLRRTPARLLVPPLPSSSSFSSL